MGDLYRNKISTVKRIRHGRCSFFPLVVYFLINVVTPLLHVSMFANAKVKLILKKYIYTKVKFRVNTTRLMVKKTMINIYVVIVVNYVILSLCNW